MSCKLSLAKEEDGEEILRVLESSPAKGSIELLYTRRPNAYISYKKEAKDADVLVVKEDDKIIGTAAEIVRELYISGVPKKMGYVCGLKKDSNYAGNLQCIGDIIKGLIHTDVEGYYCSVISDNKDAQAKFEKKRRNMLNMECIQEYTTYIFAPYFKFKLKNCKYEFKRASQNDEEEIIKFLNNEGGKKDFFPVFYSVDQFTGLKVSDFYMLKSREEIIAVGALWNQTEYKQYIVKNYNGIMKYAKIFNPILKMLGYIELPKENTVLDFPMLSFLISKDDNEEYYKAFLNNIVMEIKKEYGMFIIGTTKCNYSNKILGKLKSIKFDSKIYTVDLILGKGNKQEIKKDNMWIECGLL